MSRIYRKFGGVFFNDASWDFENRLNGVLYSEQISRALKGEVASTSKTPVIDVTKADDTRPTDRPKIQRIINGRPVVSLRGKDFTLLNSLFIAKLRADKGALCRPLLAKFLTAGQIRAGQIWPKTKNIWPILKISTMKILQKKAFKSMNLFLLNYK